RYALITDSNVGPRYAETVLAGMGKDRSDLLIVPAGESNKTRDTWARLTDQMLAKGYGRDSAVIALGGGVVGDLEGFVAATFMRSILVVLVSNTLLIFIDSYHML